MEQIIQAVMDAVVRAGLVEVEVSARHVHLSQSDLETLFGPGAQLTPKRPLSQPGQYLSEQRVTIKGAKGKKENTAVLGPVRSRTQVELSKSDCFEMGVTAPLRESGDLDGAGEITIEGPAGSLTVREGAIIAHRHIHLPPETAAAMGVSDREHVDVEVFTERPVTFRDVIIRVSSKFSPRMHIDFDEANAAFVSGFTLGKILK